MTFQDFYYTIRPGIPRWLQIQFRKAMVRLRRSRVSGVWPIMESAGEPPANWPGWPDGKRFALVLTHDVESASGLQKCRSLAAMERELGFRSSFNFVPLKYDVPADLRSELAAEGFEVGVHGLTHDGRLFRSREIFCRRAKHINGFLRDWGAAGFRSPAMHRKEAWLHALNIRYDASAFDTDPFEPYPEGVGTVFPFFVADPSGRGGYVELPYTLPQDFTLFVLMHEQGPATWIRKLEWIARKGGMALLITHPDYMTFGPYAQRGGRYPADHYASFLRHVKATYEGQYWQALPEELTDWYLSTREKAP